MTSERRQPGPVSKMIVHTFLRCAHDKLAQELAPLDGRWVRSSERQAELDRRRRRARWVVLESFGLIAAVFGISGFFLLIVRLLAY